MDMVITQESSRSKIPSSKFALYLACASITMMFAAFTSAYVVRQAAGNWLEFELPNIFWINTLVILLSSLAIQLSYRNFIAGNALAYKLLLLVTGILGVVFLIMQYQGWLALEAIGIDLKGNPSGSFVYVISGVHAAHILGGLATIAVALIHAFVLPNKVTPARKLRFELTLTYWHFVDFLWIYLILFFTLQ